ncbi:MAG: hypothetical protein LUF92_06720 [Clostridiales bacterium]|nr:hypothetical protein [Clostridiales bacterium]
MVSTLTYLKFYSVLRAIFYVAYLFGLVLCSAEAVDWAIGAAFALNAFYTPSFTEAAYMPHPLAAA